MTLGIYFHIPFCRAKCIYCHFISMPLSAATEKRYQEAILSELARWIGIGADKGQVDSIYFGGGTPSLIPAEHIAELLAAAGNDLRIARDCEISLEANPGTLSKDKVQIYRDCGVNRISIGAQSFSDPELVSIGRLHTAEMIADALSELRGSGLSNINLDLMLGLPGQTRESWKRSLEQAAGQKVPHISVYMLDLDDQCPMQALVHSGSVRLPEEDLISDLYLDTIEFLLSQGYFQYEISNFALPGYACRHNLKYWRRQPVYGFGVASHSFDGISRYSNYPKMEDYVNAVETGRSTVNSIEELTLRQSLSESLFLGLRLRAGIDWTRLQAEYGHDCLAAFEPGMHDLTNKGLVEWNDSTVRLTESGMLLSNEVFQLFI